VLSGPRCKDSSRCNGRNARTCPGRKDRCRCVCSDTRPTWAPPHLNPLRPGSTSSASGVSRVSRDVHHEITKTSKRFRASVRSMRSTPPISSHMPACEFCSQPPLCHASRQDKATATAGKPLGLGFRPALVAQGIEHRFPTPLGPSALPSHAP
jgi:hypothetical protein